MTPKPEANNAPVAGHITSPMPANIQMERLLWDTLAQLNRAMDRLDRIIDEHSMD